MPNLEKNNPPIGRLEEIQIELPGIRLAALRDPARAGRGRPLLAVHGWLDNAASFLPLAAELAAGGGAFDLVAIDLPGHGHSGHRAAGHWYHLIDYVADLLHAADALGWPEFFLLGHSLGGAVSTLTAAAAPERIQKLAVIEGLGPLAGKPARGGERLAAAWHELAKVDPSRLRRYTSIDEAVTARRAKLDMPLDAARLIIERGLRADGEHFLWRSDPRLNITNPQRFTEEQIRHFIAAIACPVLVVLADPPTPLLAAAAMQQRYAALANGRIVSLPGSHHVHMEQAAALARELAAFLDKEA